MDTAMNRFWLLFSQTVTVLLATYFVVATLKPEWTRPVTTASTSVALLEAPTTLFNDAPQGSFRLAAKRASLAVVSISTRKDARKNKLGTDPWLRFFNGDPENAPSGGLGSGVLVSSSGYILTNNHVI